VHERIHDAFVEKLVARAKAIRIGDPFDPTTQLGPLVSQEQFDRVSTYVKIGRDEGARMLCGGGKPQGAQYAKGQYFEPTVFVDVDNEMRIAQEEIFGPVACVMRFSDEADVLAKANDIVYGLAAGIQTNYLTRTKSVAVDLNDFTLDLFA